MFREFMPTEAAADLFHPLPSGPAYDFGQVPGRHRPLSGLAAWLKVADRRVEAVKPYLIAGFFLGGQFVISQLTLGLANLILLSASILAETLLIVRWSRRHYHD